LAPFSLNQRMTSSQSWCYSFRGPELLNGLLRGSGAGTGGAERRQFWDRDAGGGVVTVVAGGALVDVGDGGETSTSSLLSFSTLFRLQSSWSCRSRSFSPEASAANILACRRRCPRRAIWASNWLSALSSCSEPPGGWWSRSCYIRKGTKHFFKWQNHLFDIRVFHLQMARNVRQLWSEVVKLTRKLTKVVWFD